MIFKRVIIKREEWSSRKNIYKRKIILIINNSSFINI